MEVIEFLEHLDELLNEFLLNAGIYAPLFSIVLTFLEGILAFLPLVVFVTINIQTMGPILGGIISWVASTSGSSLTFYLCRKGLSGIFQKFIKSKKSLSNFMKKIDNLKFNQLVLIMSIPFAPSFFINVGAGLSNITMKKFLTALLIGKLFDIFFLGYIGSSFIECLTNPIIFIRVVILVIIAYIIGQIVNKKFNMDEKV